jgi:hypothetical protein
MLPTPPSSDNGSPVAFLLSSIEDYVFFIVPERAAELHQLVHDLGITFAESSGETRFIFRAYPGSKRILYSIYAVEVLWVVSYTAWLYYLERDQGEVDTDGNNPLGQAKRLLLWVFRDRRDDPTGPWPNHLPKPCMSPHAASVIDVANEITAVAIAWILHHEVSHIKLGHTDSPFIPPALSKQQERDADKEATEYILPGAAGRVARSKRALGIAIATITMVAIDLERHSFASPTHPESYSRVVACLDTQHLVEEHDAVRHVACIMLKLLLHAFDIPTPNVPYDAPMDCVNDLAYLMSRLSWCNGRHAWLAE